MKFSPSTAALLAELETLSHHRLRQRDDLGLLLELGKTGREAGLLEQLSFHGKFVSRTFAIMQRIGKDGQGYDALDREFHAGIEKARDLLSQLLRHAPEEARGRLHAVYLAMTPDSLGSLLSLFNDLSWYKNWMIDRRGRRT